MVGHTLTFAQGTGTSNINATTGSIQSKASVAGGGMAITATTALVNGTAPIIVNGASQTITGAANGTPTIPNLTINNPGTVTFANATFINLSGNYTYTSGTIAAGTSTLTLKKSAAATITDNGTQNLNNVTFASGSASAYTMTGSTMNVSGVLTMANTAISTITGGTFNIKGTGTAVSLTGTSSAGADTYALVFMSGGATTISDTSGATAVTQGSVTVNAGTNITFAGGNQTYGTTTGSTLTCVAGAVTCATITTTGAPWTVQFQNMVLNGNTFKLNNASTNVLKVNNVTITGAISPGASNFGGFILN
jgi:hypothetical protein